MITSLTWLAVGLGLTFVGAEAFVRSAASMAARFGIPPLAVGLTVVAWGTSAPELVVSVLAASSGQGGIAVGNLVGSNIFNVAVILGFAAVVFPIRVHARVIRIDIPLMVAVSLLAVLVVRDGQVAAADPWLLLAGMVAYTAFSFRSESVHAAPEVEAEFAAGNPAPRGGARRDVLLLATGLALLVFGSRSLVTGAVSAARLLEVSDAVIGLTIVAAGTSLPELATSAVAALRRQPDIAIGNVVGSNIFNVLGILGIAGLVSPLDATQIVTLDLAAMVLFALLLLPLARTGFLLRRWEGLVFLMGYAGYMYLRWPAG